MSDEESIISENEASSSSQTNHDDDKEQVSTRLTALTRFARSKRQRHDLLQDLLAQIEACSDSDDSTVARTVLAEYKGTYMFAPILA